jgi:hypothetical protein
MKRTLFLALIAVSAIVMAPLASADRHEQFSGPTSSTELLTVDTTACPDFVTAPQPYPVRGLGNFEMNATWKGTWVREPGFFTDVRGRMKGDGVDVNTGLTYSLEGKFAEDVFVQDLLGRGDFTITRSDGARMAFSAVFQESGAGSPALIYLSDVVCTAPTHA